MTMRYHNISKDDMLNGDGIRAVLFVSGCTHHCLECHNPITWDKNGGLLFDEAAKQELFAELEKSYVSGVTFSGGDPLAVYNREDVLSLIKEVKEKFPDKTVWVYSGWTKDELIEQNFWDKLSPYIDVFVEGKFEIRHRSVPYNWAGSTNQRVLRKESNFTLNTSDFFYVAMQDVKNAVKFADKSIIDSVNREADFLISVSQGLAFSEKSVSELLDDMLPLVPELTDLEIREDYVDALKQAQVKLSDVMTAKRNDLTIENEILKYAENGRISKVAFQSLKEELCNQLSVSDEKVNNTCKGMGIKICSPDLSYEIDIDMDK